MQHRSTGRAQQGSVLVIALIFLVIFTLLAVVIFRGSTTTIRSLGNMQWRSEAVAAANVAVDSLLSDATSFTLLPQPNFRVTYDANGDGNPDIAVVYPPVTVDDVTRRGPRCIRFEPIPPAQLDPDRENDLQCFGSGVASNPGIGLTSDEGTTQQIAQYPPLCANTEWSLTVRAEDTTTNTAVNVVQGVGVRVPTTSMDECH